MLYLKAMMERYLTFSAGLSGKINHQRVALNGHGRIDHALGLTVGDYTLIRLPQGFHPFLLSACIITGYPNACTSGDGSKNLFQGHSYAYVRRLRFRTGEELLLNANCRIKGNLLESDFQVSGTSPVANVESLEPLVESWEPEGSGRIKGAFTAIWRKAEGGFVIADTLSNYYIDTTLSQDGLLQRYVAVTSRIHDDRLMKRQECLLFKRICFT